LSGKVTPALILARGEVSQVEKGQRGFRPRAEAEGMLEGEDMLHVSKYM